MRCSHRSAERNAPSFNTMLCSRAASGRRSPTRSRLDASRIYLLPSRVLVRCTLRFHMRDAGSVYGVGSLLGHLSCEEARP